MTRATSHTLHNSAMPGPLLAHSLTHLLNSLTTRHLLRVGHLGRLGGGEQKVTQTSASWLRPRPAGSPETSPRSAPTHAPGCPERRPNQPLGPRWHPGHIGLGFHSPLRPCSACRRPPPPSHVTCCALSIPRPMWPGCQRGPGGGLADAGRGLG